MNTLAAFSGPIPANYDKYLGPILFEPYALDLAGRLKNHALKQVLEIACGTGRVTRHLVQLLNENGHLVATDLNPDMMKVAQEKVVDPRVEWKLADAQDLPFPDESFDHIICQFGVMFFPDKKLAFSEAWRVLKPGGFYLFNTWGSKEDNSKIAVVREVMDELFREENPDYLNKGPYSFFDEHEIRTWMELAGFKRVKIERVKKTSAFNDLESFINGFFVSSPLSAYLSGKDPQVRAEIRNRITEEMKRRFPADDHHVDLLALVCSGEKK